MSRSFSFIHQPDAMDCGATCLAMVAKHYGKTYTIPKLREMCSATRSGVSMLGISDAAEKRERKKQQAERRFGEMDEIAEMDEIGCRDAMPCVCGNDRMQKENKKRKIDEIEKMRT